MAPQLVLRLDLDREGYIREIQTVLAPGKLTAIRFPEAPAASVVIPEDTGGGEESFEVAPTVRRL